MQTSRRGDAIKLLEPLDQSNQLGTNEQFILAKAYLSERLESKYQSQMNKLLASGVKNPRHMVHFVDFLLDRRELGQAEHWVAELRRLLPRSLSRARTGGSSARPAEAHARAAGAACSTVSVSSRMRSASVAGLFERFGFAREAEAACRAFIARNPNEPERVLVLASFLARQDRTKEAIALLDLAWKTCRPEAVALTALVLYVAPSADENLKHRVEVWVAEALRKSPSAAGLLGPRLAAVYCRQGRFDEAEALLRQSLLSDPENVETLNNLAWELALREPGEPREALRLIDRAIEKSGLIPTFVDTRAVALIRMGEPDRAVRELSAARAADPRNVSLAFHLAWACEAAGKADEAMKTFQIALELGLRPEARHPLERGLYDRLRAEARQRPVAAILLQLNTVESGFAHRASPGKRGRKRKKTTIVNGFGSRRLPIKVFSEIFSSQEA